MNNGIPYTVARRVLACVIRHNPEPITEAEALAHTRARRAFRVRMFVAFILRTHYGATWQSIANAMGRKDHSEAVHGARSFVQRVQLYPSVHRQYVAACAELGLEPVASAKEPEELARWTRAKLTEARAKANPGTPERPAKGGYVKPMRWTGEQLEALRRYRQTNACLAYSWPSW
jgi:hypothetical protein